MSLIDPVFPPLLTGHAVKAPLKPFAEACRRAGKGELGAGDLVWSRGLQRAEMAIVLEPEVAAGQALQMAPLMLVAAGDCLGALLPPQVPLTYRWPHVLLANGAEAGSIDVAHAISDNSGGPPAWLVVGFGVQLAFPARGKEPGAMAHRTALVEEGGGDLDRTQILQSLSAHLLTWINIWQDDGFRPVSQAFMARLATEAGVVRLDTGAGHVTGRPLGLDDEAGLIVKPQAGPACAVGLLQAMAIGRQKGCS